jgi:hypothetical protein
VPNNVLKLAGIFGLVFISSLVSSAVICAQAKAADTSLSPYAGTWILNYDKSVNPAPFKGITWEIRLANQNQIIIRKNYPQAAGRQQIELILNVDGSGETNIIPDERKQGGVEVRSRTQWKKDKMIRTYKSPALDMNAEMIVTEIIYLSKDEKRLFLSSSSEQSPMSTISVVALSSKLVFDRKN